MNAATENTAHATATSSAIRRPRTLDELLDREEALAMQGIREQAGLLGEDVLDALNLKEHIRRKPIGTSAILAALGVAITGALRRSPRMGRVRVARSGGTLGMIMSLVQHTLAGALVSQLGRLTGASRLPRF